MVEYRADGQGDVRLEVLDALGRRVSVLGTDGSGSARWDGMNEQGTEAPPGVYLLRLQQGDARAWTRLVKSQ